MPHDPVLATRIRRLIGGLPGVVEKRMFGGVGFLLDGHMCVGVWKRSLVARVGPDAYPAALAEPSVGEFDVTGRPMTGWVLIGPEGFPDDEQLGRWIGLALDFVRTLPPK